MTRSEWEKLIVAHYSSLWPRLKAKYRGKGTARFGVSDLIQSAIACLLRRHPPVVAPDNPSVYIQTAAENTLKNKLRDQHAQKRGLAKDRSIDIPAPDGHTFAERLAASDPTPSQQLSRREDLELLHEVLPKVPSAYREPTRQRYFDGQSVEEIAQNLSLTPEAVRKRIERCRALLRKLIRDGE